MCPNHYHFFGRFNHVPKRRFGNHDIGRQLGFDLADFGDFAHARDRRRFHDIADADAVFFKKFFLAFLASG